MTRKIYRTAQGKQVDLGALQLQNENVRAVGNMGVNARGDLIDGDNRPIQTKNAAVRRSYDRQVSNVQDQPVTKQPSSETRPKKTRAVQPEHTETKPEQPSVAGQDQPPVSSGLADAIAKARVLREQPLTTHQDLVKARTGLSKI